MTSKIVELKPGVVHADQTLFVELTLTFRHRLTPTPNGGTTVRHELEITGQGADAVGPELGPQIGGDFPVAMAELFAAAKKGVHAQACAGNSVRVCH